MLVLASTSPYRAELLNRLGLAFTRENPEVDETPLPGELPTDLAARLALAKALAVKVALNQTASASDNTGRVIIGSDQVATLDGLSPLGKPGNHARAVDQLRAQSGRKVAFHTALSVVRADTEQAWSDLVTTEVSFRTLTDQQIERYLLAETPYDCAGSAKSEGLGVALLKAVEGPDATALIGLPLIALCSILEQAGCPPLASDGC